MGRNAQHMYDPENLRKDDHREERRKEYRGLLQWLSIQGLILFVLVGMVRTATVFLTTVLSEFPRLRDDASTVQNTFLSFTDPILIVAGIACVSNMKVILAMGDIQHHFGKTAEAKFFGTRALLSVQMQLPAILLFTHDSDSFLAKNVVGEHLGLEKVLPVKHWTLDLDNALLLNSSLLVWECLAVAVFNYFLWKLDVSKPSHAKLVRNHTVIEVDSVAPVGATPVSKLMCPMFYTSCWEVDLEDGGSSLESDKEKEEIMQTPRLLLQDEPVEVGADLRLLLTSGNRYSRG